MKVYLVWEDKPYTYSGSNSTLHGVYSTKEKAEERIRQILEEEVWEPKPDLWVCVRTFDE